MPTLGLDPLTGLRVGSKMANQAGRFAWSPPASAGTLTPEEKIARLEGLLALEQDRPGLLKTAGSYLWGAGATAIDILNRPLYAVGGILEGKPERALKAFVPFGSAIEGLTGLDVGLEEREKRTPGDALVGNVGGVEGFISRLALDIAFDPLTYLAFGAYTAVGKAAKLVESAAKMGKGFAAGSKGAKRVAQLVGYLAKNPEAMRAAGYADDATSFISKMLAQGAGAFGADDIAHLAQVFPAAEQMITAGKTGQRALVQWAITLPFFQATGPTLIKGEKVFAALTHARRWLRAKPAVDALHNLVSSTPNMSTEQAFKAFHYIKHGKGMAAGGGDLALDMVKSKIGLLDAKGGEELLNAARKANLKHASGMNDILIGVAHNAGISYDDSYKAVHAIFDPKVMRDSPEAAAVVAKLSPENKAVMEGLAAVMRTQYGVIWADDVARGIPTGDLGRQYQHMALTEKGVVLLGHERLGYAPGVRTLKGTGPSQLERSNMWNWPAEWAQAKAEGLIKSNVPDATARLDALAQEGKVIWRSDINALRQKRIRGFQGESLARALEEGIIAPTHPTFVETMSASAPEWLTGGAATTWAAGRATDAEAVNRIRWPGLRNINRKLARGEALTPFEDALKNAPESLVAQLKDVRKAAVSSSWDEVIEGNTRLKALFEPGFHRQGDVGRLARREGLLSVLDTKGLKEASSVVSPIEVTNPKRLLEIMDKPAVIQNALARAGKHPHPALLDKKIDFDLYHEHPLAALASRKANSWRQGMIYEIKAGLREKFGLGIEDVTMPDPETGGRLADPDKIGDALKRLGWDYSVTDFMDPDTGKFVVPKGIRESTELAGHLFPAEIAGLADDVKRGAFREESVEGILKHFDHYQGIWKSWTLAVFPRWHVVNMIGNTLNSSMSQTAPGMQDWVAAKRLQRAVADADFTALKRIRIGGTDGESFWREARRNAVMGFGHMGGEQAMQTVTERLKPGKWLAVGQESKLVRGGFGIGEMIEDHARLSLYASSRRAGLSPQDAAMEVKKYLFDYADLTDFEKNVMKRLLPFATWTRKNVPLQLSEFITRPGHRWSLKVARATRDDESNEELRWAPKWLRESQPAKVAGRYMLLQNILPAADAAGFVSDPARQGRQMLSPFISTPLELMSGTDWMRDRPIEQIPGEKRALFGQPISAPLVHVAEKIRAIKALSDLAGGPRAEEAVSPVARAAGALNFPTYAVDLGRGEKAATQRRREIIGTLRYQYKKAIKNGWVSEARRIADILESIGAEPLSKIDQNKSTD